MQGQSAPSDRPGLDALKRLLAEGPDPSVPGLISLSFTTALKFYGMDQNTWGHVCSNAVIMKLTEEINNALATKYKDIETPWRALFTVLIEYAAANKKMRAVLSDLAKKEQFSYLATEFRGEGSQCSTRSEQWTKWIQALYGAI